MILRLKPIPLKKVWGGDKLSKVYGFSLKNIGEIWGISARLSYSNEILNGAYKGLTFRSFFSKHKNYFGNYPKDEFPLLFKIIDANGDLSVQVHPNDEYASKYENSYGKDECWYILDADKDSRIQIGHNTLNKNDMEKAIAEDTITDKLSYYSVNKEDYFYIPSGKVHAICKNTTLLEVSQSSDVTYRLYDYKRLDNGKLRPLHIDHALNVISFPDSQLKTQHDDKYFSFDIIKVFDESFKAHIFGDYIYVIEGKGMVDNEKVSSGDFIVVTSDSNYSVHGEIKLACIRITK